MGSLESLFDEMKRYVRFDRSDEARLVAFHAVARPHFDRIARSFYERTREHEGAHAVFTGEDQIERLQRTLTAWMSRVLSGPYDDAYFAESAKIGRMHVRIGLPQRYMFTAMALIRAEVLALAEPLKDSVALRSAINRVLDLELAIMLETYRDDLFARIQRAERIEKAEVDRALQRAEHRYENAVELARVLVIGLDRDGRIRLYNRESERVTGYARDEVMGMLLPEALCDEEDQGHANLMLRAAQGAVEKDALDCLIRTKSGKSRLIHFRIAFAPSDAEGDDVVLFVIGQDITDEHRLAARLRQSEKLAAVGTLAAGLAHEIRNPLNGAQLHLTFLERRLKKQPLGDDAMEAVHVVADEIKRLSALVTEFLDFARPRPLDRRQSSVTALLAHVVTLLEPTARAAHVTVETDLPTTELFAQMDPAKIEQVLINLVRNAIEALVPVGGGSVTLRLRRSPRRAVIDVEDDGPGLARPDAPIFDPFFSTKPDGTGLGLAIVHRIVTDHEGSIDVESRPGRTVFRVGIPIETEEEARG
jgi:PAS domain S-box-containing protein